MVKKIKTSRQECLGSKQNGRNRVAVFLFLKHEEKVCSRAEEKVSQESCEKLFRRAEEVQDLSCLELDYQDND